MQTYILSALLPVTELTEVNHVDPEAEEAGKIDGGTEFSGPVL